MMDEFENNRENEHVDQTPHAETPYDTGDGNTDNLKRTEQQQNSMQSIDRRMPIHRHSRMEVLTTVICVHRNICRRWQNVPSR